MLCLMDSRISLSCVCWLQSIGRSSSELGRLFVACDDDAITSGLNFSLAQPKVNVGVTQP